MIDTNIISYDDKIYQIHTMLSEIEKNFLNS